MVTHLDDETPTGLDAWWFLDTLVVARPLANARTPIILEMTLPAGAAPPMRGGIASWTLNRNG